MDAAHAEWLHVLRWVEAGGLPAPSASQRPGKVLVVGAMSDSGIARVHEAFEAEVAGIQCCATVAEAAVLLSAEERWPDAIVLLAASPTSHPFHALQLLQNLITLEAQRGAGARLYIATCGAQAVDGHARERVAIEQAAFWGLGRVLAEEHPELWGGLVDLDPLADSAERAAQLAAQICRGSTDRQIAWRDGKRFALRFVALDMESVECAMPAWPVDGAWLITGGLGAVALHLARSMVAHGVRRLVLLGRHGLLPRGDWLETPPDSPSGRRIAAVRALEAAGASVHLLVADVGDPQSLERALREYSREAWPPIMGVLHAAGVLETRLAVQTDRAAFERVYLPKVAGALALERLLPEVQRFVMISSISATLGIAGMAAYAAANAALDALAHDRRTRSRHGLSIQSGGWIDTGMLSGDAAETNMGQLRAMGIRGHEPQHAVAVFDVLVGRPEA